jgi:hypothetical protein
MFRRGLLALVLLACGESAVVPPEEPDAAISPVDAEVPPDAAVTPADCPGGDASTTCVPIAESDGGFRYGCYTGSCPVGDTGSCRIIATQPRGYVEVLCGRAACTRIAFSDVRACGDATAWQCPWSKGKALAVAPGTCTAWLDPLPDTRGVVFCCR